MRPARGVVLALISVVLVSSAQLSLRWSMTRLPTPAHWLETLSSGGFDPIALAVICAGVLAYALSMLCWIVALHHLPLGRAYALLSVSYALVHLGAALLPGFGETLSPYKTLGVGLVICGVLAINSRRGQSPALTPLQQRKPK